MVKKYLFLILFVLSSSVAKAQISDGDDQPYYHTHYSTKDYGNTWALTLAVDSSPVAGILDGSYIGCSIGMQQDKGINTLLSPTGNLFFNFGKYDYGDPDFDHTTLGLEYALRCHLGYGFFQTYAGAGLAFVLNASGVNRDASEDNVIASVDNISVGFSISPHIGARIYVTKTYYIFAELNYKLNRSRFHYEDLSFKAWEKGPVGRIGLILKTF